MNEQPPGPLKIDLRLALDSAVAGLSFVLAGIAAVGLPQPYSIIAPLVVGMLIVVINRLLGRSSDAVISQLATEVRALVAKTSVLQSDATPTIKRAADDAADALRPTGKM